MINLSLDQFKEEGSTLTKKAMQITVGGDHSVEPKFKPIRKYSTRSTNEDGDTDCKDVNPNEGTITVFW